MTDSETRQANADIRRWARGAGIDLASGGRIPKRVRALYDDRERYYGADDGPEDGPAPVAEVVDQGDDVDQDGLPGADLAETVRPTPSPGPRAVVPTPPVPARGRFWGRRGASATATATVPGSPEPPRRKRLSLEKLATGAWETLATAMQRTPAMVPTGRMMALQAPLVGGIVEEQLKGTIADQLLQPLARAGAKGEALFSLFGPPAIVAALTLRPEAQPVLLPLLRVAIEGWADIAGPQMTKLKAKAERRAKTLDGLSVDDIINALFTPLEYPPQPGETEGQRAA